MMIEPKVEKAIHFSLLNELQPFLEQTVGARVSIYKNDELLDTLSFGEIYKDSNIPVTSETLCHLCSNTKAFTSALVLTLCSEGLIDLDDRVLRWVPELVDTIDPEARILNLLNHTSGLERDIPMSVWNDLYKEDYDQNRFLLKLNKENKHSSFKKSGEFFYSNVDYALLGIILNRASSIPYKSLLISKIFNPLKITSFHFGDNHTQSEADLKNRIWPHVKDEGEFQAVDPNLLKSENPHFYDSACTLLMPHFEWVKVLNIYYSPIFSSLKNYLNSEFFNPDFSGYSIAGWVICNDSKFGRIIDHNGFNPGNSSFFSHYPESKLSFLASYNTFNNDLLNEIISKLETIYLKEIKWK